MTNKFAFLGSPRFWAIVLAAVALALNQEGVISDAWVIAVTTITGGFTAVRTIDRTTDAMADAKIEAAQIAS